METSNILFNICPADDGKLRLYVEEPTEVLASYPISVAQLHNIWNQSNAILEALTNDERRIKTKLPRGRLSILTESQVRAIHEDRRSALKIAQDYGVSQQTISNIKLGYTWRHLGLQPCASRKRIKIDKLVASLAQRVSTQDV